MNPGRETVATALATLLGGAPVSGRYPNINPILISAGYKLFGRRLRDWVQVEACDKPALFLVNYEENHDRKAIMGPDKLTMGFMAVIYDDVTDQFLVPSQRANALLDAIDDVLRAAVDPLTDRVTLGGIVSHCWVEGTGKVSPGDLDNQTVITYPIRVLVP